MNLPTYFDAKKSLNLFGLFDNLNFFRDLYINGKFPKVLMLNGKKGIGKFTLVFHFINYIFSKKDTNSYNTADKSINVNSTFYNLLLNNTAQDVIFIRASENKNIKIEDIRLLKSTLSNSTLSDKSRFIIIDEVEFMNTNSVNALLKTLEEPTSNNFFILINNQQTNLIETISSRCLKTSIFLTSAQKNEVINYLVEDRGIENLIDIDKDLSPGLFLKFNEIYLKYKINKSDNIFIKLNILINAYKKEKDKSLISLTYFLIDYFFFNKIHINMNKIEFLLDAKSSINKTIKDFVQFNLNTNTVLNSIKIKLNNV